MHQAREGFGFSPPSKEQNAWQAGRWSGVVDIEEVLKETAPQRDLFWRWLKWDAPPYSGGVLTDWPAREADALAFAKREWAAVQAYLRSLEA